jgi:hypothetical protein
MLTIDDVYKRYLVRIIYNKKKYYVVNAINSVDEDIYIHQGQKIILFDTFNSIIEFIRFNDNFGFDKNVTLEWVLARDSNKPYTTIELDVIKRLINLKVSLVKEDELKVLNGLFELILFLDDLLIQTDDLELKRILNSNSVKDFKVFAYNSFVYNTSNELNVFVVDDLLETMKNIDRVYDSIFY